jgi:hypothetical protein
MFSRHVHGQVLLGWGLTFPGDPPQVKAELAGCTNGGSGARATERRRELIFRKGLRPNGVMAESRSRTRQEPKTGGGFADPAVERVFAAYPARTKGKLLALRRLILETAARTPGVGALEETLKWGQPSYLTPESRSGSTIRIDRVKPAGDGRERYALYVHCQTSLVSTFRQLYRDELTFGGNRSILLDADRPLPKAALRHCIALALTYHRNAAKDYL